MNQEQKRKSLLKLSDRDLVNRILAFPDRQALNRDEEGIRITGFLIRCAGAWPIPSPSFLLTG